MKNKNKKYLRADDMIIRVDADLGNPEVLTEEGKWKSASNFPGSFFMQVMNGIPLSEEEIATLPK